ncbi:MAG: thioredoxin domain-containing protein [Anaerolineae bacterium]|nr:thioredoxin domain-containing protein [Anaerolineae bacterium]
MQNRVWILVLVLLLLVFAVSAQETSTQTTVGPMTVTHDDTWHILAGPADTIIMAEFDPTQITAENPMPDDAIIIQLRLFGLNRIAGLLDDDITAFNIAGGLIANDPASAGDISDIIEIESAIYTYARVDVTNETLASYVYVAIFNDVTFGIITTSSAGGLDILNNSENRVLALLDTLILNIETPFPEEAFTRYEPFPRSLTSEGFPMLGSPDAAVSVRIISSFDCDDCRLFHDEFFPILFTRMNLGEINIVFIPIYGTGAIPLGDSAARASLCVGVENFWAFHDILYLWQDFENFAFVYERLQSGAANTIAIPPTTFDDCYTSNATNAVLEAARQETFAILGQQWRTPTVTVNGLPVEQLTIEDLLAAIDGALDAQGQ